jgi:hypothetical protein
VDEEGNHVDDEHNYCIAGGDEDERFKSVEIEFYGVKFD